MPEIEHLNYAKEYLAALMQNFPYVMYFGELFATPNNNRFRWVKSNVIEIPSVETKGRVDGDRDTITVATRKFTNKWTPLTLMRHRVWSTPVHPFDVQQTNDVVNITNITRVYNEEQKIPEMQAYLISKLYSDFLEFGRTADTVPLSVDNILERIDMMMTAMDEARVPRMGRLLYVTPPANELIINAKQIHRHIDLNTNTSVITRGIKAIDDLKIRSVPSDLMKTLYNFDEGWEVDSAAQQIDMFMVHPNAVITPISYEFAQLDPPSAGSNGNYVYFEEAFEDVFLLEVRKHAAAFHVSNP